MNMNDSLQRKPYYTQPRVVKKEQSNKKLGLNRTPTFDFTSAHIHDDADTHTKKSAGFLN